MVSAIEMFHFSKLYKQSKYLIKHTLANKKFHCKQNKLL